MKFGKLAPSNDERTLNLANYLNLEILPVPPENVGYSDSVVVPWGILGNDKYGDCVLAGAAHETMLWNALGQHNVSFNESCVLSDYSAITGFDPRRPSTDQGTNVLDAAKYRQKIGIVDTQGNRHKVAAYMKIPAGNTNLHRVAVYLFGAVGIGIEVPKSAQDQFQKHQVWDIPTWFGGRRIIGGHYIPIVGFKKSAPFCVTWGRIQPMTEAFFKRYNDESYVYLSEEMLVNGKNIVGFDKDQLLADLAALRK